MRIAVLQAGGIDPVVMRSIQQNLNAILSDTETSLVAEDFLLPEDAYDERRQQYRSDIILTAIHGYAQTRRSFERIMGIVDVDLFVPRLSFVFGEAEYNGIAAVISLWRLRPEFYGKSSDVQILVERGTKEAVHELGHTLGLNPCANPFCVMHFSNSIFETDRKKSLFCNKCYSKTMSTTDKGSGLERRRV